MNLAIIEAGDITDVNSERLKTPKHLIKIGNEYLIERIIKIARKNCIQKVCCLVNSSDTELREYLSTTDFGIPVKLIIQNTTSTLHSLFLLSPFLLNERFCLVTTDSVFTESEFSEFCTFSSLQEEVDGFLAVKRYDNDEKPLCVAMNEEDTILKFSDYREGYSWVTGGIYSFSPRIFYEMEYALETGISKLRNFLRLLVTRNYLLKGYTFSKIISVDNLSDVKRAEEFLKSAN